MNTSITPKENIGHFRQDIADLFHRVRGGHTNKWVYHDGSRGGHQPTGSQLWTEFTNAHSPYYIKNREVELIDWSIQDGTIPERYAEADTMIDFGSGDAFAVRHKALPIILGVPNIKIYSPVDLSAGLLESALKEAKANVNQKRPPFEVQPILGDFYEGKTAEDKAIALPGKVRAAFMFGSTITNAEMQLGEDFPRETVVGNIQKLAQLVGEKGKGHTLTFGYDANQDIDGTALEAYNHDFWRRLVAGLMLDVQSALKPKGDFDPLAWRHVPIVDKTSHVIHQCIESTETQTFTIGDEGFLIKPGEQFVVNNNFKFPHDVFAEMIEEAGYQPDPAIKHQSGTMVLQSMHI